MDPLSQNPLPPLGPPVPPVPPLSPVPIDQPVEPPLPPMPAEAPLEEAPAAAPVPQSVASQVAAALQESKNVLVTVSVDPSVDELASALGLTLLLGKLDKHATAVFSGKIPSAMEFLDPEKTFEDSVDSLRDFIIALDKDKADKLRYKVEDDVVKVFITPYRTTITEKDLEFSQGDFNVDVVITLGVTKQEELDGAIASHGRILHDATVVTVNSGNQSGSLGSVDWHEPEASSIAEMIVTLQESLASDLLDSQVSTALLTGLVAETNRFSNDKTTPKVMNIAAQLMAAGANQQLVATNLRQEGMLSESVRDKKPQDESDDDNEVVLDHNDETGPKKPKGSPKTTKKTEESKSSKEPKPASDTPKEAKPKDEAAPEIPKSTAEQFEHPTGGTRVIEPLKDAEKSELQGEAKAGKLAAQPEVEPLPSVSGSIVADYSKDPDPSVSQSPDLENQKAAESAFGGSLNATTAQVAQTNAANQNMPPADTPVTLSHDGALSQVSEAASLNDARKAVEAAAETIPSDPAVISHEPYEAAPLPPINSSSPAVDAAMPQGGSLQPVPIGGGITEPTPVDAFMQPQTTPNEMTEGFRVGNTPPPGGALPPTPPLAPPDQGGLPPLPPLPHSPTGATPPLPPLPGQPDPAGMQPVMQPQINPGFIQNTPQSQNHWTQAADDVASKQADKQAARDTRAAEMDAHYNQTVDRQRELQGLPPVNDPKGSGLPPVPPLN